MDDSISRQAAIAEFSCCELTPDGGIDANYAIDFLTQLPSVQPDIVRCKDCKHRPKKVEDSRWLEFPDYTCVCQCDDPWYEWMPDDDFYCAYGERRDEDGNT